MIVAKFGGTSVGSAENIEKVIDIAKAKKDKVAIVVSALAGITNKLIEASELALDNDTSYFEIVEEIEEFRIHGRRLVGAVVAKQPVDLCTSPFTQMIAREYLKAGHLWPGVENAREIYARKRIAMLAALEEHLDGGDLETLEDGEDMLGEDDLEGRIGGRDDRGEALLQERPGVPGHDDDGHAGEAHDANRSRCTASSRRSRKDLRCQGVGPRRSSAA